ncbi:Uncharacterised protein [Providencia rustigianii]|nr:Uncharacterised protein [Providencia rustigianii]
MKLSKSIIIASSLLAISFSTFAYHGNGTGHGSWPNHNNHTQAQYERPCSNYAGWTTLWSPSSCYAILYNDSNNSTRRNTEKNQL